ncbi:MAG: RecX family transcriptional regulator [Alphaproteobacteria bacterium]|nr:RecX family transcriptional regulator [Alphaproteobacteria bacterium]
MFKDKAQTTNSKGSSAGHRQKKRKTPKKITESYLHNSGLYYLQRFSTSTENFRRVMMRKVDKSCRAHPEQKFNECEKLVGELIAKFIKSGLLDDKLYARGVVNSQRRSGKSVLAIQGYLRSKGLHADIIEQTLAEFNEDHDKNPAEAEFESAMIFARKKRLGPFRTSDDFDIQKELGRLARAGYSYDTARRVLDKNIDDEDLIGLVSY